jgi:predicted nucleic-acid-binding protein
MPLAVDTNILARALTDDGSEHARRALEYFLEHDIFVSDTVLLETEWVLRAGLKVPREKIRSLFAMLLSRPNVIFADRLTARNSVVAYQAGFDFADALHLFAAQDCEAMITYDEDFIRRSRKTSGTIPVKKP